MRRNMRAAAVAAIAGLLAVFATTARGDFAASPGSAAQASLYNDAGTLLGFNTYTGPVDALAYDRDGHLLAILGDPGSAGTIVGLPNNVTVALGTLGTSPSLAANPFGGFAAAAGGSDHQVNFYDAQGNLTGFSTYTAPVDALAYDPNGHLLAIIGTPGSAGTIVGVPGSPPIDLGTLGTFARLAASPLGGFAATAGGSDTVNFYDAAGNFTGFTTFSGPVDALAFDRFGHLLAIVGVGGGPGTIVGLPNNVTVDLGTLGRGASLATLVSVPEPSSLALIGLGLGGVFVSFGRSRRRDG